jgi:signal transduction histidine kinase
MHYIFRLSVILVLSLIHTAACHAQEEDKAKQLQNRFFELYNASALNPEFYTLGEELAALYRENDQLNEYFRVQINMSLYDIGHDKPMDAMKRANQMMEEMEQEHYDGFSQVYMVLGTIFESRGNYRMAQHYYNQGIKLLSDDDKGIRLSLYSRMAYLLMFLNPVDAEYWNKRYYDDSFEYPAYHQVYLFINGMINFTLGNSYDFKKAYASYQAYHEQNNQLDSYGMESMKIASLAFEKKYDEALAMLGKMESRDLSTIGIFDMRTTIYQMMGNTQMALKTAQQRAECIDSLNSDMMLSNLNEMTAQAGLAQIQTQAAKSRERTFIIIMVMAIIIIATLTISIMRFRKNREQLKLKNEQLGSALAMAEEGEKMKTEFVRSVSHEIRTPLNAINGFNELLNTPGLPLSEEERSDLLNRIKENVQAITNIVDEMLRVADKESNEFYAKEDKLYCNQFFSSVLYEFRDTVSANIELKYTTGVINRFQITSNEEGLRKIMEQLIQNAAKFTSKGSIIVRCEESEDKKTLLVSVTDTGKGIAKEQQDKIFEGFYKVDSFQQGIGLGLTVSKKIAHKLGGDLTLDCDYTDGARFILSLPLE